MHKPKNYESRKRQRINEDGSFMSIRKDQSRQLVQQTGSSGKGDGREVLGEWMKMTSER
jgi:hypothetical protein